MNATSVPSVRWCCDAAIAPIASTATSARFGMTSRNVQNRLVLPTRCMLVPYRTFALRSNSENMCADRPNALMTRTDCIDSSTVLATSPVWSWIERDSRV